MLAIDAKRRPEGGWEVYTHGGRRPTGRDAVAWAREGVALGAGEILLTSMDADGQQTGYDLELTAAVAEAVSVPVIASGGAGSLDHLADVLTGWQGRRGAGRLDLPLWDLFDRRGEGPPSSARPAGASYVMRDL